jgi:hypothetical protein
MWIEGRLFRIWRNMKQRCNNPNCKEFKYYGARDIKVCDEWNGYRNFEAWAVANGYQENFTLDRINNSRGYAPDNCRWVSHREQQNNKTNNHYIAYRGRTQSMRMWCEELGLSVAAIEHRINRQRWTAERAFDTPVRHYTKEGVE